MIDFGKTTPLYREIYYDCSLLEEAMDISWNTDNYNGKIEIIMIGDIWGAIM